MEKLLTKRQVVEAIGVPYPTIWKWMREGAFPLSVKVGRGPFGRVAWRASELQEWINSRPRQRYLPPGQKKRRRLPKALRARLCKELGV